VNYGDTKEKRSEGNMKTQEEIIQEVLKNNNGYAYFSQIYNDVFTIPGNSFKKENKYKESIRGYVQRSDSFFL